MSGQMSLTRIVRKAALPAAVGIHRVDLEVAVPGAIENDTPGRSAAVRADAGEEGLILRGESRPAGGGGWQSRSRTTRGRYWGS